MKNLNTFIERFVAAFKNETLVKLTLSGGRTKEWRNVYAKRIILRDAAVVSFTLRYAKRDETKNMPLSEAASWLDELLPAEFAIANLLTTTEDSTWERRNDGLKHRPATQTQAPEASHNNKKQYLIPETAIFLQHLGLSSPLGRVHAQAQDKFRQINKYVEIMDGYLAGLDQSRPISIVDMGCGKGYLSFALFSHWREKLTAGLHITGLEIQEKLNNETNAIAQLLGYAPNLSFKTADISAIEAKDIDVLVALHACDTATDIAIAKGIKAEANLIIVSPCCHKQVRRQIAGDDMWRSILKHGILEERQAELLTDGIRALLLEAEGYRTQVFEFVGLEHTAKNLMITAVRTGQKSKEAKEQVARLKSAFGITDHALESLLSFEVEGV